MSPEEPERIGPAWWMGDLDRHESERQNSWPFGVALWAALTGAQSVADIDALYPSEGDPTTEVPR